MAIRTVWTADASQADRAVAQMERSTERLERQIHQTVSASKASGRAASEYGSQANKSYGDVNKRLDELHQRQNRLLKEKESLKNAAREQANRERELARAAKQVYDDTRTPAERYAAQMEKLNRLAREGRISHETFGRAAKQAHSEMAGGGRESVNVLGMISGKITGIASGLLGAGGIAAAGRIIADTHKTWLANLKETSDEIKKLQKEYTSFAALQEPGEKRERVEAIAQLAATYGITDRAGAFDVAQAMQSIHGKEGGIAATTEIFEAERVGIPIDLAKELEVLGKSQGAEPGQFTRMAYIAGKESGRDPATLARAAPGIKYFADPTFGFAFAGAISENIPATEVATYTRRGGMALGDTSSGMDWFREQGLEQATQIERLQAMHKEGITTPAVVKEKLGISEIREAEALADAARNLDRIVVAMDRIEKESRPGIFQAERAHLEKELPEMRYAREAAILQAKSAFEQTLGPRAEYAAERDLQRRREGLALRRLGKEESGAKWLLGKIPLPGFWGTGDTDTIDPEGRATEGAMRGAKLDAAIRGMFSAPGTAIREHRAFAAEEERIRAEIEEAAPRAVREPARLPEPAAQRESILPGFPGDDGAALQVTPTMRDLDRLRDQGGPDQAADRRHRELLDRLDRLVGVGQNHMLETRRTTAAVANAGDRTATATQDAGRRTSDAAVQSALRPGRGSGEW